MRRQIKSRYTLVSRGSKPQRFTTLRMALHELYVRPDAHYVQVRIMQLNGRKQYARIYK